MSRIVVTGAEGFLGKAVTSYLKIQKDHLVHCVGRSTSDRDLREYLKNSDVILHLAGINRSNNEDDFRQGNVEFTRKLTEHILSLSHPIPIIFSSSIQAEHNTAYGRSKLSAEEFLQSYATTTETSVACFRLPNVFGAGGRPNYNSVVATFCYNIARGFPITIDDPGKELRLVWSGDVAKAFVETIPQVIGHQKGFYFPKISCVFNESVGQIAELIQSFHEMRKVSVIPDLRDRFTFLLHSVYTSYLSPDRLSVSPALYTDNRGSLFELVKSNAMGQVFVSTTKPGITRGQHYHFRKVEKYCVVQGEALISLRKIGTAERIDYHVSAANIEIIDIPIGYTHSITNTGNTELTTLFWANEIFDIKDSDTFAEEV